MTRANTAKQPLKRVGTGRPIPKEVGVAEAPVVEAVDVETAEVVVELPELLKAFC